MLRGSDKGLRLGRPLIEVPAQPRLFTGRAAWDRYKALCLVDSPLVLYPFDDASGSPVDHSGNARDITTVTGTPTYRDLAAIPGTNGIRLNSGDALERSTPSTNIFGLTCETWFYLDGDPGTSGGTFLGCGSSNGVILDLTTARVMRFVCYGFGTTSTSVALTAGTWNHIAWTCESGATTFTLYVNGLPVYGPTTLGCNHPAGNLEIHKTNPTYFTARWQFFAIYQSRLTAAKILQRYLTGVGL